MAKLTYRCSWCKCEINEQPHRYDYVKYNTDRHVYWTYFHYDFCDSCFNKIAKFMQENDIRGRRVKPTSFYRK